MRQTYKRISYNNNRLIDPNELIAQFTGDAFSRSWEAPCMKTERGGRPGTQIPLSSHGFPSAPALPRLQAEQACLRSKPQARPPPEGRREQMEGPGLERGSLVPGKVSQGRVPAGKTEAAHTARVPVTDQREGKLNDLLYRRRKGI